MAEPSDKLRKLLRIAKFTEEELGILKEIGFEEKTEAKAEYYYSYYFQINIEKTMTAEPHRYSPHQNLSFNKRDSDFYFHVEVIDRDNHGQNLGGCFRGNSLKELIPALQSQIKYGSR